MSYLNSTVGRYTNIVTKGEVWQNLCRQQLCHTSLPSIKLINVQSSKN